MNKTLTAPVIGLHYWMWRRHPPIPNKKTRAVSTHSLPNLKVRSKTVDIDCQIIRSEGDWETQLFTVHDRRLV